MSQSVDNRFILSFDVEEFFQVEAAAAGLPREQWHSMPKRLEPVVNQILQLLADKQCLATFFVLGWVARQEPDLIRLISQAGHEIASHGMTHRMLHLLGPEGFRQELLESRKVLEDLSGKPVFGFRAPTFSITRKTAWALDVLADADYTYDSSIFPIHHDRYGVPEAPLQPHIAIGPAGRSILELPPLTWRIMGFNVPIGGGGYLRLLPVRLIEMGLNKSLKTRRIPMIYLHPWELDADQPVLPMTWKSRFRHRMGLRSTYKKLNWLLGRHHAMPVNSLLPDLQASVNKSFTYG